MGDFRFNTIQTFDVGLHHGHSAFRLLRFVYEIEKEHRLVRDRMAAVPYGQAEYLRLIGRKQFLTTDMFRTSSASVMMFQGMMEAIINDCLEREGQLASIDRGTGFGRKWRDSLNALHKDRAPFDRYHSEIYTKFRNPMVHPKQVAMTSFDDLSFEVLLSGYRNGWLAFELLYDGLGHPHDRDSWGKMCAAYEVPSETGDAP